MTPSVTEVAEGTTGLALLCDPQGNVAEVVRDGLGVASAGTVGRALTALVDPACTEKARAFFDTLRAQQAVFNWEILVVAARSRSGVARFYEELVRINNEQANALRAALKEAALQTRSLGERDGHLYDELSRLNNELATTQRELAKKNAELARLNEQKNQFLGMASHDLRNPLEVILTYSDFLLEDAASVLGPTPAPCCRRRSPRPATACASRGAAPAASSSPASWSRRPSPWT